VSVQNGTQSEIGRMVAAVVGQPDQLEHPLGGSAGSTNPLLLLSRNGVLGCVDLRSSPLGPITAYRWKWPCGPAGHSEILSGWFYPD
jgi:hypothetical protein